MKWRKLPHCYHFKVQEKSLTDTTYRNGPRTALQALAGILPLFRSLFIEHDAVSCYEMGKQHRKVNIFVGKSAEPGDPNALILDAGKRLSIFPDDGSGCHAIKKRRISLEFAPGRGEARWAILNGKEAMRRTLEVDPPQGKSDCHRRRTSILHGQSHVLSGPWMAMLSGR